MPATTPLRLVLSPSPGFAALILVLHATAAACLLTVLTGFVGVALAVLLILLGLAAAWDRALLRGKRSPRRIEILPTGEAQCVLCDGSSVPLRSIGSGGVARHWVALRLHARTRRAFLATSGMLPADSFRLLRLWARWGRLPPVASGQLLP